MLTVLKGEYTIVRSTILVRDRDKIIVRDSNTPIYTNG